VRLNVNDFVLLKEKLGMRYCKQCVQPDTRPGILFDDEQVCSACRAKEELSKVDWNQRENELREIASWAKEKANGGFDCVVGVSGGKDSTFQALYAKERLGLKVLLANCAPNGISDVGRHNLENLVQHGFDMVSIRPNPRIDRELCRRSFFKYGNFVKPSEYPLWASAFIIALKFGVPLVIQGENPALTLGVVGFLKTGDDATDVRNCMTLGGGNADDWVGGGIELKDLVFYQFPDDDELRNKVRAIYLGYYAKEWSVSNNTKFSMSKGLKGRPGHDPNLTGKTNPYYSIDVDMKVVNQMLKYYKFGFGATTDEVCSDIRDGILTRDEGIELVKKYDGKCGDGYIQEFCDYIGITMEEFWRETDRWVNKELFEKDPNTGKWNPLFTVGEDYLP
jgi:N-acetyl sugar amidotransferase